MIGTTLGHYRILHTLGAGGMGEVYAAEDTHLNRRVDLKLLPAQTAADPAHLQRFRREAQAVAALNHPNVVTIYSVEEAQGVHFLTMEIVEGQTLVELIGPTGVTWPEFFKWAISLADAVSAAHQQGIIHRDLKPANVMIGAGGRLKVLDFGVAKLRQDVQGARSIGLATTAQVTAPHQVMGTAAYMSPEQAEGRALDARSDIFSLGVVLYEMATGVRPFRGETGLGVLSSIMKDPAPLLSDARTDAPRDLDRIIRRCLSKEPARRYQTAIDVRNELEDLQQQLAIPLPPTGSLPAQPRTPQTVVWSALAIAAVAAGGWGYTLWTTRSAPPVSTVPRASFSQLTHEPGIEWFPSLSPDGRWVVYAGDAAGNRDIYLQSVSGQTAINLTKESPADDDQPAFSPDGERIVFRSTRDGGGIFVMGRTGEAVRRLTRDGFNPAWSRDGTQIAYTSFRLELRPQNTEGVSLLWVINADGGEPHRLTETNASLPSWSPTGARIAFGTPRDLFTIGVARQDIVPVTDDASIDWNPVWAPDGRYLYFVSDRGGSTNIWRVAIDESSGRPSADPEPITSPAPSAAHLTISADGGRLAYSSVLETQNIQKIALDQGTAEIVGAPTLVTTGSRFWANPDPSPDGQYVVAYSQVNPEGDLYVIRTDGSGALRQLTSDVAIDRVPRWSPDGDWIAAFSDRSASLQVWKIRVDGSDLQQVTSGEGASVAAWDPSATRLAVTLSPRSVSQEPKRDAERRSRVAHEPGAAIVSADGKSPVDPLPPAPAPDSRFVPNSWSQDGRWITGQSWYGVPGVSVFDVRAHTFLRLSEIGEWPVFLPDSRRILFVSRGREFHVLDMVSKQTKRIFSVFRDTLGPPRVTHDGRAAFFSRRVTESDVWLVNLR